MHTLYINTLARLTETILCTKCLDLEFKAEIYIKEVKSNSVKQVTSECLEVEIIA